MRISIMAIALIVAAAVGCEKKAAPKMEGEPAGIEIQAPGVDVKVKRGEGVDVKAPGVDIEAKPKEGEVKVDTPAPN